MSDNIIIGKYIKPQEGLETYCNCFKVTKVYKGTTFENKIIKINMDDLREIEEQVVFEDGKDYLLFVSGDNNVIWDAILDIDSLKAPTKLGDKLFKEAGRNFKSIENYIIKSGEIEIIYVNPKMGTILFRDEKERIMFSSFSSSDFWS